MKSAAQVLDEMGIEFYEDVQFPVASMKSAPSESQVRSSVHRAPKRLVREYKNQMVAGTVFPPPVLDGRTGEIVDGYTRHGALRELKILTTPVIIADFPDLGLRKIFAGRMNQMGAQRLTARDARNLALEMLARGYGEDDIQRALGASASEARKWHKEYEARMRLEGHLTEQQWDFLTSSHLSRIGEIRLGTPVMIEAARLIADAGIDSKTSSLLVVSGLNRTASQDEALVFIKELQQSGEIKAMIAKRKSGYVRRSHGQSAAAVIRQAATLLRKRTIEDYVQEINGDGDEGLLDDLRAISAISSGVAKALTGK